MAPRWPVSVRSSLLSALTLIAALPAQEPPTPTVPPSPRAGEANEVPVDAEARAQGAAVRRLTLGDAMRLGRARNVGLRAAELQPEQARLDLLFADAAFEPELYGNASYGEGQSPARNLFQPSIDSTTVDAAIGWRQRVVTGGLFDLAFHPSRYEYSGSSAFPSRQYSSIWTASFRQPLLRGAWTDYNLAPVTSAHYSEELAKNTFESQVQDTLLAIVQAYWELVFARENWRVVDSALAVAVEQLRITDERIRVADLAPRDRIADEAEVARQREELIVAENNIRSREDELRRLLFEGNEPELWHVNLQPASPIEVMLPDAAPMFEPLVAAALAQRPDLRSARNAVAIAEVAELEASRDTLPGLDLVSSYSSDGVRDQFHDAWADSTDQQYPDWSLRLEFVLPLGNHAAKARAQKAALEVERQRRLLNAATLDATKQVREAVRNLTSLAQSVRASTESVRLAENNLETERVKLRVGASTAFEVQRRNQELSQARSRRLRNLLDYRTAESRLAHVQGKLRADVE
ncbi:MAG: TolC family protein [Planctomycetes bacterium]|nr:TolC family protein [Planctomycetota bacterium]MCC7399588.1 TolC family protein [Planctomycetota bacterium]